MNNLKVDDSTWVKTIPTPKNWKCKHRGCKITFKHKHTTFADLKK